MKVSPADSHGALAFFHLLAPPMTGPPRHVHSREDELFHVLEGEIVFDLDGERHTVGSGGTVYLRRGVVHAYQNFTATDARLLIATTPGGFSTTPSSRSIRPSSRSRTSRSSIVTGCSPRDSTCPCAT